MKSKYISRMNDINIRYDENNPYSHRHKIIYSKKKVTDDIIEDFDDDHDRP